VALRFRGSKAELRRSLSLIPQVLAGRYPDSLGLHGVFWASIGNTVLAEIEGAYRVKLSGGVGADGIRWQPLAAATLERRARAGRTDDRILLELGELLRSLEPGTDDVPSGAKDQVFAIGKDGVTVGSQNARADFHQHGVPGRLPARPIVPPDGKLPPGWQPALERAIEKAMAEVIRMVVLNGGIA